MAATFSQKTIAELFKKSGQLALSTDTADLVERTFEVNGGSWQAIAGGDAQQIGLLKQCVRGVMSGQVKPKPAPPSMAMTAEDQGLAIGILMGRHISAFKHHLKAAYQIATAAEVNVTTSADRLSEAMASLQFRSGAHHHAAVDVLGDLLPGLCVVGAEILRDIQAVRAWQVDGGADHPFDSRVAAVNPILKRSFLIESSTYQSPWDTLRVLQTVRFKLALEPRAFLRERVETRLASFFEGAAEALEAV